MSETKLQIPEGTLKKFRAVMEKFNILPPATPATPAAQVEPVKMGEKQLADGTTIKYDTPELTSGSVVTIVTPEGEMPAPEGEHTLQDGTKIVVEAQNGQSVVTSVTPSAEPQMQSADTKIAEINKILQGYKEQFAAQKTDKENLEKQIGEYKAEIANLKKDVYEFMKVFEEFVSTPSAEPAEPVKNKKIEKPIDRFINRNK